MKIHLMKTSTHDTFKLSKLLVFSVNTASKKILILFEKEKKSE